MKQIILLYINIITTVLTEYCPFQLLNAKVFSHACSSSSESQTRAPGESLEMWPETRYTLNWTVRRVRQLENVTNTLELCD